jgi:hypothetical protein
MDWKGFGRKLSWRNLRYYSGIFVEGLSNTTKTLFRISGLRVGLEPRTFGLRNI